VGDKTVIHVVDDDPAMRDSLAFLLDVNGFAPKAYESANAFLSGAAIELPTCVVSDIRMPGLSGIELVRELKARAQARLAELSPRERDVLQGLVAGKINKVIAHELSISPRTVEVYRANLMAKTGARSMSELMRIALAAGL
jgi:FixJ family two-component response regulator